MSEVPDDPRPPRPRWHVAAYCAVLACLASVLMFWELGGDAFTGDEAQYALVVHNLKRGGGNWLNLTPYPPGRYLQKPPLYFWLTALTHELLGREEFSQRAWSAAAGVGVVVLTCVLGATLFTPEVGAAAGLLLLVNRSFLLVHGARSGTFDALLTLLTVAAVLMYVVATRRSFRWSWCAAAGALAGLASLTKPLAGVPLLALLAIHAIAVARGVPLRNRLAGLAVMAVVMLVVAAPWYAYQWRAHDDFVDQMFRHNLVERIAHGIDPKHVERWYYYPQQISKSSIPFFLTIPACLFALAAWAAGPRRQEYALLTIVGTGWIVLFSTSASKAIHYAYPVFPLVAVLIVQFAAWLGGVFARKLSASATRRTGLTLAAVVLVGLAFQYARTLYHSIPASRSPHVPWEMHKLLAPAIQAGEAQAVFYGFPDSQLDWRSRLMLGARDCYYLERMRRDDRAPAVWTSNPGELASALLARKPTLLISSRLANAHDLLTATDLPHRIDRRFAYADQRLHVLGIDLAPVLEPGVKPGESSPYVRIDGQPSPGVFQFTITPAVSASSRMFVRVRLGPADMPAAPVRYVFTLQTDDAGTLKRLENALATTAGGVVEVSAFIDRAMLSPSQSRRVSLTVSPSAGGNERTQGTVEHAWLLMLPHVGVETHPSH